MATKKLKSTREAEGQKIDLAVKYAEQGKATGGGSITPKKVRRAMEARYVPNYQSAERSKPRRNPPRKPKRTTKRS